MQRFEKRKKLHQYLYNRVAVTILALLVVFLALSVFSVFQKRQEAYRNAMIAQNEVTKLRESELKTQESIDKLDTQAGVEEAIRNKYRAAKEGEGLIVIADPNKQTLSIEAQLAPPQKSFWQRIIGFFKGQ
jgi:cell division protein FtsB